ncbi:MULTISPECIES: MFS transporter [unclassified Rhizobium]|uniref:MFS transporter n=1 Tax=unclassified Rhizobium TaxID=2613769 RepID=UPI00161AD878|nr:MULTISPECIES: MFS transporter [unclassified Rhizobium]MBB3545116.1 putative MFS family arabinose efflux permease [Rhizobium sp. BK399]MCS3743875.1 putative MFS family arabinose efflux permease [Rhizobium sp. BK661]MCS4095969.1 putative MFS family arabinose efflux permease [Rhizobium sp. BK176]
MGEVSGNAAISRDPASLVIGATAAQIIGGLVPQMSPFVVAGLIDGLSLPERDAGFIASVELLSLATAAILIAPFLSRFSYKRASLFAIIVTLSAQGASIFVAGWSGLLLLRGLAGTGEGVLYAISLSIVASHSQNPEKIFGYFQLVWAIGSIALFSIGGEVTAAFAHRGIFTLLAATSLAFTPLLLLVPNVRAVRDGNTIVAINNRMLGVLLLAAIVLYVAVSAGLFAFSGPLGERVGLDTSAVGYVLTASTLVGLVGAGTATVLNVRWGRATPITGFCVGYILVVLALCLWPDPWAYRIAVIASAVLYYFSLPYLFGLAAALDSSGRWAAAAGAANLLGFAAGPVFAGVVIGASGYASLAAVSSAMIAAAWVLAMYVIGRGYNGRSLRERVPESTA